MNPLFICLFCALSSASLRAQTSAPTSAPTSRPIDLTSPTLVSLDLRDADVHDATAALAKESGAHRGLIYAASAQRGALAPITLKAQREPYLVALAKLCVATGTVPGNLAGDGLSLVRQRPPSTRPGEPPPPASESWLSGPAHVSGPFLVIARSVTATRSSHASNPQPDDSPHLALDLALLTEPKVAVVGVSSWVRIGEATDETGATLLGNQPPPPPMPQAHWMQRPLSPNETFNASLDPGRPIGRRIATLKGAINLKVVTSVEVRRMEDLASAQSGTFGNGSSGGGGMLLGRSAFQRMGNVGEELAITVERGQADEATWRSFTELASGSRFAFFDAQGRAMPRFGWESPFAHGNRWTARLRVRRTAKLPDGTEIGPPTTLVWELPLEAKEVEIPFEFKNLPLP